MRVAAKKQKGVVFATRGPRCRQEGGLTISLAQSGQLSDAGSADPFAMVPAAVTSLTSGWGEVAGGSALWLFDKQGLPAPGNDREPPPSPMANPSRRLAFFSSFAACVSALSTTPLC